MTRTRSAALLLGVLLCSVSPARPQAVVIPEAERLQDMGRFRDAAVVLRAALNDSASRWSPADRRALEFEIERLHRIRLDYSLTRDRLWAQILKAIPDATPGEFDGWVSEGRFDGRAIEDTLRFLTTSRRNLFWRYPQLNARRQPPPRDSLFEHALYDSCHLISETALSGKSPYVQPRRFHALMRVETDPDAAPAGSTVRAWLPFPRRYPFQFDMAVTSSTPAILHMDKEESAIRSAYFEQRAAAGRPVRFVLEYDYTATGVRFDLHPPDAEPFDGSSADAARYLGEGPHVLFTERILRLARRLVGTETNPVIKARRFYDWLADSVQYSHAHEYSTLRNISDFCLTRRYGDCGQHALLFISLCRSTGIPARWQSGWFTFPGGATIHDWCEIYVQPWGWIPVDPDMGIMASQYFTTLTAAQRRELRDFFFGGLDQYRMIANSDHCQELTPPKRGFRSDTVDFQRGELEADGRDLYFNRWDYHFDVTPIPFSPR